MALDYAAEIESVQTAIASGTTKVSYDGKMVDYGSFQELLMRLRWLEGQLNAAYGVAGRPLSSFAAFDRGDA